MLNFPQVLFGEVGVFYGILLPLVVIQILALLLIPSLLRPGAKPDAALQATYCYLMQIAGVLLMTLGGVPALYSVLAGQDYTSTTYLALLIVFGTGGFTFLWHDNLIQKIDEASKAVPQAIYLYTFKFLGYLASLLATLTLLLTMLLGATTPITRWWVMPVIVLAYGLLLLWCTRSEMDLPLPKKTFSLPSFLPPTPKPFGKIVPVAKRKK